jgi:hypothetical protein
MAEIPNYPGTEGGNTAGSGLPAGVEDGVLFYKNGAPAFKADADIKATSVVATESVDGGSLAGGAVTVTEGADTSQLGATSLTFNAVEVSDTQFAGIAATSMDATHPPVLEGDGRLADARTPQAHGEGNHLNFVSTDDQVRCSSLSFSGNFAGIAESGDSLRDVLQIADALPSPDAITPQGRLGMLPAFNQLSGDVAVALTSANHKLALLFAPDFDVELSALSLYLKTIGTQGNVNASLCATTAGLEADGALMTSVTHSNPTMTTNSAPSPNVVGIFDKTGANAEDGTYVAWKAFADPYVDFARSNAAGTAGDPIYFTLDVGDGNTKAFNRIAWFMTGTASNGMPGYITVHGSNVASPTVNTDNDWTLIATNLLMSPLPANNTFNWVSWVNSTGYRHWRLKITSTSVAAYVQFAMRWFEAGATAIPSTQIASLGAFDSGASNGAWIRNTFTAQQLIAGKQYALMLTGTSSVSFSPSINRSLSGAGADIPDQCSVMYSADGGTTWQTKWIGATLFKAMLNLVLNSTAHHSPQLYYGGKRGLHTSCYESGAWVDKSIPSAAVALNVEGLTAGTLYNVYLYDNTGTLTLEAVTTDFVYQTGRKVKSGATSRIFVGQVAPREWQTGYRGPVFVKSRRGIWNEYNRKLVDLGHGCPYFGATTVVTTGAYGGSVGSTDAWRLVTTDYSFDFVCGDLATVLFVINGGQMSVAGTIAVAVDGLLPTNRGSTGQIAGAVTLQFSDVVKVSPGSHIGVLVESHATTGSNTIYLMSQSTGQSTRLSINGTMEM